MKTLNTLRKCLLQMIIAGGMLCCAVSAFAQNLQLTLTPSNHNGYNISCFGVKDGSIDLSVTGGTPPYQYSWSNGATTQDVSQLAAGYYNVDVLDAQNTHKQAEITLTEPLAIKVALTPSLYPNNYNVSCYECYNGSITSTIEGGVTPYTYLWYSGGQTTANLSNQGVGEYKLLLTDANGCSASEVTTLRQPDRSDWTMGGNTGTNPANQFIGTLDNTDLAFRTNNSEVLRLGADGNVGIGTTTPLAKLHVAGSAIINSLAFDSGGVSGIVRLVGTDPNGQLKEIPITVTQYTGPDPQPCWENVLAWSHDLCNSANPEDIYKDPTAGNVGIGLIDPEAKLDIVNGGSSIVHQPIFRLRDNDLNVLMQVNNNGEIGINTTFIPNDFKLAVNGKIISEELKVKLYINWPDNVFDNDYNQMSLYDLECYLNENKHLPGIPSAQDVERNEGFNVGELQTEMLKKIEELTLYVIQLQKEVDNLTQQLNNR